MGPSRALRRPWHRAPRSAHSRGADGCQEPPYGPPSGHRRRGATSPESRAHRSHDPGARALPPREGRARPCNSRDRLAQDLLHTGRRPSPPLGRRYTSPRDVPGPRTGAGWRRYTRARLLMPGDASSRGPKPSPWGPRKRIAKRKASRNSGQTNPWTDVRPPAGRERRPTMRDRDPAIVVVGQGDRLVIPYRAGLPSRWLTADVMIAICHRPGRSDGR
jgi:hypothetical protein